ncbi:MAG: hypothetical protein RTU30_04175 [Candidatus Thorarchaeota archaeon]
MNSLQPKRDPLRKVRFLRIVFLAYALVLPFIILILPQSEIPVSTGPYLFSWLLILLMPVDILLIYVFYRLFGRRTGLDDLVGPAVLMYTPALAPSIYAMIIGFIDSALRYTGILLGLMFSVVGFWIASILLSNLCETIQSSNQ